MVGAYVGPRTGVELGGRETLGGELSSNGQWWASRGLFECTNSNTGTYDPSLISEVHVRAR
jgi:hypothetical protein